MNNNFPVIVAAILGNAASMERLLKDPRVDATIDDNKPLKIASEKGHLDVVEVLLKHGIDPTTSHNYVVRTAARNGRVDVLKRLLEDPRVDPKDVNDEVLKAALINKHSPDADERRRAKEILNLLFNDPRIGITRQELKGSLN